MTRPGDGFLGVAGSAGRVKGGYWEATQAEGGNPRGIGYLRMG